MNRPAYERGAFLTALETEVIDTGSEADRPFAITADTIFYPEGGGQPADHGSMGDVKVVDVLKTDGVVAGWPHRPRDVGATNPANNIRGSG